LKPGQSSVTSNKCATKTEALAKYNLNASSMNAYTDNQLVQKSAWVSELHLFCLYIRSSVLSEGDSTTCTDNGFQELCMPDTSIIGHSVIYRFRPNNI
jgi:hypothetical protein